jgi:hypothetical protein
LLRLLGGCLHELRVNISLLLILQSALAASFLMLATEAMQWMQA